MSRRFKRAGELLLLTFGLCALFIVTGAPTGGGSGGGITACSGDINAACSQVTSGTHLGAGTVPNASLVTAPITACSGDINAGCSQVTSGSHLGAGTVPNASLVTAPITACSGDINAGCSAVTKTNGSAFATSATTDTTNAGNIATGLLAAARGGLGVAPFTGWNMLACGSGPQANVLTANTLHIEPFTALTPFVLTSGTANFSGVNFRLGATDAVNNSDVGFYYCATPGSGNCSLIEDVGAQHINPTVNTTATLAYTTNAACTGAGAPGGLCTGVGTGTYPALPATEPPGLYIWAATSAASTISFDFCNNSFAQIDWFAKSLSTGTSSGGALPATIASPTLALSATGHAFGGFN